MTDQNKQTPNIQATKLTNIHEFFASRQADGCRDSEMDWGASQGHELSW